MEALPLVIYTCSLQYQYCAVQKNSVPAAAGAVATSHTVFLLNRVYDVCSAVVMRFMHSYVHHVITSFPGTVAPLTSPRMRVCAAQV